MPKSQPEAPQRLVTYAGQKYRLGRKGSGNFWWIERGPVNDPVGMWVHVRVIKEA